MGKILIRQVDELTCQALRAMKHVVVYGPCRFPFVDGHVARN